MRILSDRRLFHSFYYSESMLVMCYKSLKYASELCNSWE